MKTATEIKSERIERDLQEQEQKIRTSISRTRSKLMNTEDEKKILSLQMFLEMKKQELFELTEKKVEEFTITFTKRKEYGDYFVSAKLNYSEMQACITKTDGKYWSSCVSGEFKYLKDIKERITESLKLQMGVKF